VQNLNKNKLQANLTRYFTIIGIILLSPVITTSCGQKNRSNQTRHKPNIDYHRLFEKTQGTWISYEYVLNLKKTNSPSASSPFMDGIFSFTVDSTRLFNDTLHCTAWVNGRQERDMWIAFDADDSVSMHNVGILRSNEQNGPISNENYTKIKIDSQFLTIYTSLFDSVRYVYFGTLPRNASPDYVLKYYTTSALFHGDYYTADSNMIFSAGHISFDPEKTGRIYGSPVYDSFDINVSAISQTDSIDYMELFDSKKQNESHSFMYKFQKNTLLIYPNMDRAPCRLYKMQKSDSTVVIPNR